MGLDKFTEVSHQGGLSRIGGSFGAALFGIILFLASFPLLWWNEGRAVDRMRDLEEGQAAAVAVQADSVDSANEGKLIHLSGEATTDEELADAKLGVKAVGLRLRRVVEMYQWEEEKETKSRKKVGGGRKKTTTYSYEKVWSDDVISSSDFKQQEGHQNPGAMPISTESWNAKIVTVGAFTLSDSLVAGIDAWKPLEITAEQAAAVKLPGERKVTPSGAGLYAGENPASPAVGDLRISFKLVAPTVITLISGQAGSSFQAWATSRGGTIEELRMGSLSKDEMFAKAHSDNTVMTWVLRLGGFLAMAIGLAMVFSPLTAIADVIPFVGSIVGAGVALFAGLVSIALSSFTIGLAWLFYRPLIGVPMLIVTAGCFFMLMKVAKARKGGDSAQAV